MEGIPVALRFLFKRRGLECQRASSHVDIGMKACLVGVRTLVATIWLWTTKRSCGGREVLPPQTLFVWILGFAVKWQHAAWAQLLNVLVYVTATLQLALGLFSFSDFLFALNPPFIRNLRNSSDWICMAPWTSGDSAIGPTCARPSPARRSADPSAFSWRKRRQSDWQVKKTMRLGLNDKSLWHLYLWSMKPSKSILPQWLQNSIVSMTSW